MALAGRSLPRGQSRANTSEPLENSSHSPNKISLTAPKVRECNRVGFMKIIIIFVTHCDLILRNIAICQTISIWYMCQWDQASIIVLVKLYCQYGLNESTS